MKPIIKHPSAWLPIVMSLATIVVLVTSFSTGGLVHDADEGVAAHLFQILMFGQAPIVAFFAIRWLPEVPKHAIFILALQIVLALIAMFPVYYFKL